MAQINFNPQSVEPAKPLEPVPTGKYPAIIVESDVKPAKSGKGLRMPLTAKIIGGEFTNRKVFDGLNIEHENPVAQQIGQEQLAALCVAVGHRTQLTDTQALHGKPFLLSVGFVPESYETDASGNRTGKVYKAKNSIDGFEPLPQGYQMPAAAAPTGPAAGAPPAWANPGQPAQAPQTQPATQPWEQPAPVPQPAPNQTVGQPTGIPTQQPAAQPWEQPVQTPTQVPTTSPTPPSSAPPFTAPNPSEPAPAPQQAPPVQQPAPASAPAGETPPWAQ